MSQEAISPSFDNLLDFVRETVAGAMTGGE